jgi:small-conductance mechanosensitive channel
MIQKQSLNERMQKSGEIVKHNKPDDTKMFYFEIKKYCRARNILCIGLGIIFFLTAFAGFAEEQTTPTTPATPAAAATLATPAAPTAIPIENITTQATEASDYLSSLQTQFLPDEKIETFKKDFPSAIARMEAEQQQTQKVLQGPLTLEKLQAEGEIWQKNKSDMANGMALVSLRVSQLQSALIQLAKSQTVWHLTLDAAKTAKAPDGVIQEINALLPPIDAQKLSLQSKSRDAINLQSLIAKEATLCGTMLDQINQTNQKMVAGDLAGERLPIWSKELRIRLRAFGFDRLQELIEKPRADITQYLFDPSSQMPFHYGFLICLSVLFYMMRRKINQLRTAEDSEGFTHLFDRPFAAALVVTLLIFSSPYLQPSPTIKNLFEVLSVAAMIRLMKPLFDKRVVLGIYATGLLFTLDMVRHALSDATFFDQSMIVFEALAGMAILGWTIVFGSLKLSFVQATGLTRLFLLRAGAIFVLMILSAGLVSGALGFMLEARIIVSTVLGSGAVAMILYALIEIVCGVAAFSLRVWPLRLLHMIHNHRELLERRIHRFLVWLAVITWLTRVLDYVGLFRPTVSIGTAMLAAKLEKGSISISIEDILLFALTVWASFLLSAFIRFMLKEDIYPRTRISSGVAYATSRLLHYVILVIGFIMGMGLLGIDLTRMTVLIGAFGVGIGFGLQVVANNFVSGLILLFERPIHIADNVEVGSIQGIVKHIGMRSSIIRTRQGADVIVPNSQLISEQVINWTLSDRFRRVDLPVGIIYNAAPRKVIEVIEAVASAHPQVLKYPPPQVIFTEFGDSAINYELRAWTEENLSWKKIKSELAVAVYDAILAAGMSFPFPQREVRLLTDKEA